MRPLLALMCMLAAACGDGESCLEGDDGCVVTSPCPALTNECGSTNVRVHVLTDDEAIAGGMDALASPGDVVLENDRVIAVIDALDHPHYVAPSGGNLLDLGTRGGDDDSLNVIVQATGLLPDDAARYEHLEIIEEEGLVAVQVRGSLDGDPDHRVATRYEMRACDAGVRVRTEIVNLGHDPRPFAVADGFYWGARSNFVFAPFEGGGFDHPEIELSDVNASYREFPFLTTLPSTTPAASYFCVPCSRRTLSGFHAEQVTAAGLPPRVVAPRDYEVYERFIGVVHDDSLRDSGRAALEMRGQLFGEDSVTITGGVRGAPDGETGGSVLFSSEGTPWAQAPLRGGRFEARVPADRTYDVAIHSFGREVTNTSFAVEREDRDVGVISVAAPGTLALDVLVDGAPDHAMVFLEPADEETEEDVRGSRFGLSDDCAPYLGSPYGGSPGCNRALVSEHTVFSVPAGRYDVYASAGLFATVARERIEIETGRETAVSLSLQHLRLLPDGVLSGDFHVHGGASFDSSFPDRDRVRAFLAAGVDVLAATDHDVVHDYAEAMADLNASDRVVLMAGVETTGHVLFDLVPGDDIPRVIGHWNFWPVAIDDGPYRGAPWDEIAEPGLLITRFVDQGFDETRGIVQLNHPWGPSDFGRDLGFPRAIGLDTRDGLPREPDGSGASILLRTPRNARFSNGDYQTQEVMNTSANDEYLAYRALWFYYLSQGFVRAGTANSDSHTLTDNVLGTPRNLVWTSTTRDDFDPDVFNRDVRDGHMIGTSGPVLEVTLDGRGPSVTPFEPSAEATLSVRVSAAPWVPVEEVRIVVNGEVTMTIDDLPQPDPYENFGLLRLERTIPLDDLLDGAASDVWIVVEAGAPLMPAADLDCDGIPDTGDNDGNGVIDEDDVDVEPTRDTPSPIDPIAIECDEEIDDVGLLRNPPVPRDHDDPRHAFGVVVPGAQPASFSNPFLLDLDGGGWRGPAQ